MMLTTVRRLLKIDPRKQVQRWEAAHGIAGGRVVATGGGGGLKMSTSHLGGLNEHVISICNVCAING